MMTINHICITMHKISQEHEHDECVLPLKKAIAPKILN